MFDTRKPKIDELLPHQGALRALLHPQLWTVLIARPQTFVMQRWGIRSQFPEEISSGTHF